MSSNAFSKKTRDAVSPFFGCYTGCMKIRVLGLAILGILILLTGCALLTDYSPTSSHFVVTDKNGLPIAGAAVTVSYLSNPLDLFDSYGNASAKRMTDQNGKVSFWFIHAYRQIEVRKAGYLPYHTRMAYLKPIPHEIQLIPDEVPILESTLRYFFDPTKTPGRPFDGFAFPDFESDLSGRQDAAAVQAFMAAHAPEDTFAKFTLAYDPSDTLHPAYAAAATGTVTMTFTEGSAREVAGPELFNLETTESDVRNAIAAATPPTGNYTPQISLQLGKLYVARDDSGAVIWFIPKSDPSQDYSSGFLEIQAYAVLPLKSTPRIP